MPTVKHKDLPGIASALGLLQHGRPRNGNPGDREPPVKLEPMTGVRLARIRRAAMPAYEDFQAARDETVRRFATVKNGEIQLRADGEPLFPDPLAEADCKAALKELGEGEVEIADTLRLSEFRRKERDPETHKVEESDLIEPDIIDGLFPLLILED